MPDVIHLRGCHPAEWAARLKGCLIGRDFVRPEYLIRGRDVDVYKPDGSPLLKFRHRALPEGVCGWAFEPLIRAAVPTDNRGTAAAGGWQRRVKLDGSRSKVRRARPVLSGLMGYMDAHRQAGCRQTKYTRDDVAGWVNVTPFVRAADLVFRHECPDRYAAQMAAVADTNPALVIPRTSFTTVTVNRNWPTAVHKDKGDLSEGFGVMAVLRAGEYRGGYLVFPRYGVGVDMGDRDVLLADVHEWHGNTPILGTPGAYERISTVMYFRTRMRDCRSPAEEQPFAGGRSDRGRAR